MAHLFTPKKVGAYTSRVVSCRVVRAPMTRLCTIQPGDIPSPMMADYYGQRVSEGCLEIKGVSISIPARSYLGAASFYYDGQMEGWRAIANAVQAKGSRAFMQLIHGGRQSHVEVTGGVDSIAPSVVAFDGVALTKNGFVPVSLHRALETEEIPGIIEEFRVAAQRALDAGFDGVELHGANGYLVDQFIEDGTNKHTDAYGGPIENRGRFLREAVEALISVWGAERVGVRTSSSGQWGGISDSNPEATFGYVAKVLDGYKLAYLHVIEPRVMGTETLVEGQAPVSHRPFCARSSAARSSPRVASIAREPSRFCNVAKPIWSPSDAGSHRTRICRSAPPRTSVARFDREAFWGGDQRGYIDFPAFAA
jgi:N-ethylmaleimide reductase